ncbi:MAG TPA: hypothetical protein VF133_05780 [Terriglobales bacterium]
MSGPQLELAFWVSQPVFEVAVAAVLYRRKLHKEFPAFFVYVVAQIIIFSVQFPVYLTKNPRAYFDVFWAGAALNVILAFKIIHEIFLDVFRPYPALKDFGTALFKWAGIVMVLGSSVMIFVGPPGGVDPLTRSILIVQRCVDLVQCGLVIFLLAFCKSLRVSWGRLSFGIALGFGLISGAELFTSALYTGTFVHVVLANMINMGSWNLGLLLWLSYAVWNRKDTMIPVLVPQRWDEALTDLRPSNSDESLIPMFEHMVDRALSRAQSSHL